MVGGVVTAGGEAGEVLALVRQMLETADRWQATEPVLSHELRTAALRLTGEVLERTRRARGEE